ncbi:MAG: SHOCT domain-containing protein [bacterium]|nr:SHOCT domain-containing protein [bacterium]
MMYYYGNYDGGFFPFHFLGFIGMLAFWALVIAGIVWLVRNTNTGNGTSRESALDILKTRYAKGEITREQFESMKKDIHA